MNNKSKQQEALDKILESCKDDFEKEVKRRFYDYLVFGDYHIEMHADGAKEVCPFCPEDDPCKRTWCPYTEKDNESKN